MTQSVDYLPQNRQCTNIQQVPHAKELSLQESAHTWFFAGVAGYYGYKLLLFVVETAREGNIEIMGPCHLLREKVVILF
jgi:hypothetical protein